VKLVGSGAVVPWAAARPGREAAGKAKASVLFILDLDRRRPCGHDAVERGSTNSDHGDVPSPVSADHDSEGALGLAADDGRENGHRVRPRMSSIAVITPRGNGARTPARARHSSSPCADRSSTADDERARPANNCSTSSAMKPSALRSPTAGILAAARPTHRR